MRRYALALASLTMLPACHAAAAAPPPLLLEHATLIDGRGGAPLPDMSLLVEGQRIKAIFRTGTRRSPADARRIDLSGRFVIPGLIDSHVHLKTRARDPGVIERILSLVLRRSGVTTVRDMGGNGAELVPLARNARGGDAISPDILLSSLFTGPASRFWLDDAPGRFVAQGSVPGTSAWFRHVTDPAALDRAVAEAKAFGASGIKVHSGFDAPALKRIGALARRHGLSFWAHAYVGPARPSDAVTAGASIISHADMLAYEGSTGPGDATGETYIARTTRAMAATPVDGEALRRLFVEMRRRGVCLEPTLLVMRPESPTPAMAAYFRYAGSVTARAHRMGVRICAGTDGIGGSTANLPVELELLVSEAGLTPMEAISAATANNALSLGLKDRGMLAAGLRADLVVLSADPSRSIANIRSVEAVIAAGRYFPADAAES